MQLLSCFPRMLSVLSFWPPGTTSLPQTFHWQDSEYRNWRLLHCNTPCLVMSGMGGFDPPGEQGL
jgi:hypothetical protein